MVTTIIHFCINSQIKPLKREGSPSPSSSSSRQSLQVVIPLYQLLSSMESQNSQSTQSELQQPSPAAPPASKSCRKKKSDDASFLADVKDHIDEFVNASMDEHKTCFTKTIQKMFGMSKIVAERNASVTEVESILPLKTTVSD